MTTKNGRPVWQRRKHRLARRQMRGQLLETLALSLLLQLWIGAGCIALWLFGEAMFRTGEIPADQLCMRFLLCWLAMVAIVNLAQQTYHEWRVYRALSLTLAETASKTDLTAQPEDRTGRRE